jgi:hypothetical protein
MDIVFTEQKESFPAKCVDQWINCFAHVRNMARDALLTSQRFGNIIDIPNGKMKKKDPNDANPSHNWGKSKDKPVKVLNQWSLGLMREK